jgi:hypothetical protein
MMHADQAIGNREEPGTQLLQLINGFRISQMIGVAAKLGLADLMIEGPQSIGELAQRTGTDPRSLYRVLRALSSIGTPADWGAWVSSCLGNLQR